MRFFRLFAHARCLLIGGLALAILPGIHAAPEDLAPSPSPAAALPTVAGRPAFCSARTTLWLGHSAVIPLRSDHPCATDQTYTLSTGDAGLLEILRPPTILDGETQGYLRVRTLKVGRTRLSLGGAAALDVEVRPDPAGAAFAGMDAESPRPRIVSPVPDAVAWGRFAVGVDVFDEAGGSIGEPRVQLRLPNGRTLDPVARAAPESGPTRHFQFEVTAEDLPPGPARLVATNSPTGFTDVDRLARKPGSLLESEPVTFNLRRPKGGEVLAGACADPTVLGTTKELYGPGRSTRFGTKQPPVADDPAATGGHMVKCVSSDPAWCLPFNAREAGEYQMIIRARGDLGGGAFPTVGLYVNQSESPAQTVRLTGARYHRTPVGGPFHLDAGWQMLTVRFINDFAVDKEDRNFYLDAYEIARVGDLPPTSGPSAVASTPIGTEARPNLAAAAALATDKAALAAPAPMVSGVPGEYRPAVLYPANGANVFGVDAVVARVSGGDGVLPPAWVDVLLDGQPQGTRVTSPANLDGIFCPLLLRQVAPGQHRLSVRVADATGRTTDSPAQQLQVLPAAPAARGPYERAVFLLDRLAFGPDPKELAAVLTLGESVWLNNRLNTGFDARAEQALLRIACARFPKIDDENQGVTRALTQWIGTENPVRARFTAWAENRFSTWMDKTKPAPKWHEHLDFCRLGIAPFADLLDASAHSPAMLVYLDQKESFASKLNENYAREIMELHTLGVHGGYAQSDVTALAGVLNGWSLAQEGTLPQADGALGLSYYTNNEYGQGYGFRFVPALNDGKARRVFGLEFPAAEPTARYDRVRLALEMLASHPSTAEHVCRKLAEHYVGVPAPEPLVRTLAQTFLETGGDMRLVLRTMASHPAFWNAPVRMATPFDYGLRVARLCRTAVLESGGNPDQALKPESIGGFLKKSGMGLFDRVTPDGYPEDSATYIDSNALLQRWHFMEGSLDQINRLVPNGWRKAPAPALLPAANEGGLSAPPVVEDPAQRFIDLVAVRLTGRLLSPGSNQAAREILAEGTPDRMKQTILLISLLPETSLR